MEKLFFEAFPKLDLDEDLCNVLNDTKVTKVSTNRSRDAVSVYLYCHTLIPKRRIRKLEKEIKSQVFYLDDLNVNIIEKFDLSSQYSVESFFEEYKDSIYHELNEYSSLLFAIIKRADFVFEDDNVTIILEDNEYTKEREEEILHIFSKIFCERAGLNAVIDFDYKEVKGTDYQKKNDLYVKNRVDNIIDNLEALEEKEREAEEEKNEKNNKEFKNQKRTYGLIKSSNKDVIFGKEFDDDAKDIINLNVADCGEDVVISGEIFNIEYRAIRDDRNVVTVSIYDQTDSIDIKFFIRNDLLDEFNGHFKKGVGIKVKGLLDYDKFTNEIDIYRVHGVMKSPVAHVTRMDNAIEKRVELHCHTKSSEMDGVSSAADLYKKAKEWGHKALALTDHGVVQAFTEKALGKSGAFNDPDFKIILGCEAYIVDDYKTIVTNPKGQDINTSYVVFDIETTGLNAQKDKIIEIGAVKVKDNEIVDKFSTFVNPKRPIPYEIYQLTSISDEDVIDAPTIEEALPEFLDFCEGCVMVAHNAEFDMGFIQAKALELNLPWDKTGIDTLGLARYLIADIVKYTLDAVAKKLKIDLGHHHRAVDDALCTTKIFIHFMKDLIDMDIHNVDEINVKCEQDDNTISKLNSYHCIILAKNDIGRINLYRLVSESHLRFYRRRPKMPKSLINEYREGLIIGSACEAGELYRALLDGRSDDEIARIVQFYDYLEIQPVGNNMFMIDNPKIAVSSVEDIQDINKRIVKLGEQFNKPVCATCDVHFLNPADEVYRRIIMAGKGFDDADNQAPLYLHTTDEMLDEFSYLGYDKAKEVVIESTNLIADMCDKIKPTRPDKCPPVIKDSDSNLREICMNKAHEMYGDKLPPIVEERLERELKSIIDNGYAVMYIIAQKLVWKSVEDGYLVGSRGSVGSSFAATMAGITEVNPLSAHYLCPNCHYVDFDSDEVLQFKGRAGCDMPDKVCPNCGTPLNKEGFDIPFETFLGFKGDKEPDIDLNFSSDYQSKAHKYAEVIFGEGQTYKAGTIGGLKEKTAFGYIKKYYEEHGVTKRKCEINRLVDGCIGVRRTTGQHPGGIIVLPKGENIYSFTPIQHPANDAKSGIITTHFDYHSIDSNLLKLDMLGHDDPNMIRMLEDITGIDATKIPLDDEKVMSLFKDTSSLEVKPEELWGNCDLGTLGVPEFGTSFAMDMLRDAKPKEFSDLVRISGLSHGTDVWIGNAQDLILSGKATISTAICTRDDIMTYLISKGLPSEEAFTIMENVRKGKVAADVNSEKWLKWKQDMLDHDVPDWYIESCEKIKYMFPKAHAVAYVMMAWRIAYCKINYPLAYYTAYFSIRAKAFNYELMCMGKSQVEANLKEFDDKEFLSDKEKNEYSDMLLVQEMYARGYDFLPLDLYKSDSRYFKVEDGKIRPPFIAVDGMGEAAADSLMIAAAESEFISKDDLRNRGGLSKTVVETLDRLGITKNLPQSDQFSLFDMIS
ncbi:MAG: PolC-type DNA polymerase III [Lachnospiraceae bacterium]|nr:PolC-type DNA polymerase III [Lachnospiraceae bacterium]